MRCCFGCGVGSTPSSPLELVDDRPGGSYGGATIWACDGCAPWYAADLTGLQLLARVRRA